MPSAADPYATAVAEPTAPATGERASWVEESVEYQAGTFEPGVSSHERAESASVGELLSDVSRGLSTLLHQEVELAKAEVKETATKAGKGAGMLSGAAMAGWFTLLFLSLAVWELLAGAMDNRAWAAVVVMAVWAVVAAVLAAMGRNRIKDIQGMPRTVETAKRVPDALKGNEDKL
jgi:hypothetical protein